MPTSGGRGLAPFSSAQVAGAASHVPPLDSAAAVSSAAEHLWRVAVGLGHSVRARCAMRAAWR